MLLNRFDVCKVSVNEYLVFCMLVALRRERRWCTTTRALNADICEEAVDKQLPRETLPYLSSHLLHLYKTLDEPLRSTTHLSASISQSSAGVTSAKPYSRAETNEWKNIIGQPPQTPLNNPCYKKPSSRARKMLEAEGTSGMSCSVSSASLANQRCSAMAWLLMQLL